MIRTVCLAAALALSFPLAGPARGADQDPALVRLAEQSGCGGRPLGYVAGYFVMARITLWHDRRRVEPAELRVRHEQSLPLSAFVVRDEPWRTGPAGQVTAGPIVDAVDGAVGEQWVCHRGAWLVRVHH